MKQALLLIDLQRDFMPGGTLAVPDADTIIPTVNALQTMHDFVIATQDWHPANHASFASNHPLKHPGQIIQLDGISQVLWPDHCIQNTLGASFAENLMVDSWRHIIQKGTDPRVDSYSGFFDNAKRHATALHAILQANHITHLTLAGVATDYCVKFTALDALALGYKVTLSLAACRGVNVQTTDSERAIVEMRTAGVRLE